MRGVRCVDTGRDISDLLNAAADRHGFDAVGFLGGAIAESNLAEHAARERAWPDVSYGLYQQTVKYYGHQVPGVVLSGTVAVDGAENRRLCREWFWDAGRAIDSAADAYAVLLAHWGDPLEAWCRWNKPSLPGSQNPNAANYRRGLALAESYRVTEESMPPTATFSVGQGVLDAMAKHNDEPRGNEAYISASYSLTPGRDAAYLYSQEANQTYRVPLA